MLLERTISQLDIGPVSRERAQEMGRLGYMQWLGALRGDLSYPLAARQAYLKAMPFARTSPAVAVFCELLLTSAKGPLEQLDLSVPGGTRRGGAQARRGAL